MAARPNFPIEAESTPVPSGVLSNEKGWSRDAQPFSFEPGELWV